MLLFYVGVLVFGALLVELQDILDKAWVHQRERSTEINAMVEFLRKHDVPHELEAKMVEWIEMKLKVSQQHKSKLKLLASAPPQLQRQLSRAMHRDLLARVLLFDRMDSLFREDLLLDLWTRMEPELFEPLATVATFGAGPTELYNVVLGTVVLRHGREVVTTLCAGECKFVRR